jgi:hypothetical protein
MTHVEKLLSISSDPLSRQAVTINLPDFSDYGQLGEQLAALLRQKNGFYAFESALHVFPAAGYEKEMTLSRWNSFGLWRHEYGDLIGKVLFFGEDTFGDQFCLNDGQICSFDAETAELQVLGCDLEAWAKRILEEYGLLTGYPLVHKWQKRHGPLLIGTRLMPKIPFVLGGEYALENFYTLTSVSAMKSRGNLARQIKNLPDGTQVEFRIID